jgi:putative transposase
MLTFQYRLYPNKDQQVKLWQHANKLNFLYNYFLNQKIENYKQNIKTSRYDQQKELTTLKKNDPLIKEIHSQVLQQVALRLEKSYKKFFKMVKDKKSGEKLGFPKFRSCKNFFGICYPQSGFIIKNNTFRTKTYGNIKFSNHREIKGKIKQAYITCDNNKYYLNVCTDEVRTNIKTNNKLAIDIGLKDLIVGVNEFGEVLEKIRNKNHSKYFDKQIAKLQSERDKCTKKGSRRHCFLSKIIKRLYGAKIRKTNDFQHKVSKRLASNYDTIFAEDLSVKKMSESNYTNLNKAIRNSKFAQLISFLKYKTNKLVLVNPFNTSKTCNSCGTIHDIDLSIRHVDCQCGNSYDRDENAARNIFCLGQAILKNLDSSICTELEIAQKHPGSLTIQEALTFR